MNKWTIKGLSQEYEASCFNILQNNKWLHYKKNTVLKKCPSNCYDLFGECVVWHILVWEPDVLHILLRVVLRKSKVSSESQQRPTEMWKDVENKCKKSGNVMKFGP